MATTTCPVDCQCHTGAFAPCSIIGGCGSGGCGRQPVRDDRYCLTGKRCREFDSLAQPPHPAYLLPGERFCEGCLVDHTRDIRNLVYDYLDLAQLQAPTMSQAMDAQPRGKAGPPMPLKGEPEALQAEIQHVTTLWADELRRRHRLAQPKRTIIVGAWHTTVTNPPPPPARHHGAEVQTAVATLTPRIPDLSRLAPRAVYPTGCEDTAQDVAGWEAITHLSQLHHRARAMLGRTRRTFWVPGDCWQAACAVEHHRQVKIGNHNRDEWLFRSEPERFEDEPPVRCRYCDQPRTYEEYQRYIIMLIWPNRDETEVAA